VILPFQLCCCCLFFPWFPFFFLLCTPGIQKQFH
jgi:hypothetical protein